MKYAHEDNCKIYTIGELSIMLQLPDVLPILSSKKTCRTSDGKNISAKVVMTPAGEYVGAVCLDNDISLVAKLNNTEILALNNVIELPAEDGKRPWQMIYRALQLTA